MAGGESQLLVVVAGRWLSDFTEVVSRYILPSLASKDGHGAHSDWLAQRVRYPQGLFSCQ